MGHIVLKLILLPLLLAVLLLQWTLTFAIRISAWVFDMAAGLIALICVGPRHCWGSSPGLTRYRSCFWRWHCSWYRTWPPG